MRCRSLREWSTLARNSFVSYGLGLVPCQMPPAEFAAGMYLFRILRAVESNFDIGIIPFENGAILFVGSVGLILDCEKSPIRSSAVGTTAPLKKLLVIWRSPEYVPKKKVLLRITGPPKLPPN